MVTRHRINRLLAIQEIKANPRNARSHSKAQIRQIAESIKAFGFGAPVPVDETRSRSPDAKCTCGVPLTAKARVSKFSFSPNATRSRHCGWRRESPYLAQATSETQATLQHETERL